MAIYEDDDDAIDVTPGGGAKTSRGALAGTTAEQAAAMEEEERKRRADAAAGKQAVSGSGRTIRSGPGVTGGPHGSGTGNVAPPPPAAAPPPPAAPQGPLKPGETFRSKNGVTQVNIEPYRADPNAFALPYSSQTEDLRTLDSAPVQATYGARDAIMAGADTHINRATDARGAQMEQAKADYDRALETRGLQLNELGSLQDVATGRAPSLAGMRLRDAAELQASALEGAAASARGTDAALARRDASARASLGYQQSGRAAAAAQLEEQRQARTAINTLLDNARGRDTQAAGTFGQLLGNVRGQDISTVNALQPYAALTQQGSQFNADLEQRGRESDQQTRLSAEELALREGTTRQAGSITAEQLAADQSLQSQIAEVNAAAGIEQARMSGQTQRSIAQANLAASQSQADRNMWSQILSSLAVAGGTLGAAAIAASDERAKENIEETEVIPMFKELGSHAYDYKDPDKHGHGRRRGPMAQEFIRAGGSDFVREHPDGTLMIDINALALASASAIGELARKVDGKKRKAA